jgi:uncharacterized integral membrane protein (TIGR00698 family)
MSFKTVADIIKKYIPGLILLLLISLSATWISGLLPAYIGKVFITVVIGILIANIFHPDKKVFGSGIKLGLNKFLKAAIILMGAGISMQEIASLGVKGFFIICLLMCVVVILTFLLGQYLGVSLRRKILIAVGVCICGNSAIVATAPLIEAEEEEVAMGVGIVTLFGVLGVLLYPIIGRATGMSDNLFGMWAGTAINDTSQVVAAGFSFSEAAGKIATTIKLVRNIMIVPVVLIAYSFYRKNKSKDVTTADAAKEKINILKVFPLFVLGFILMAVLNSLGIFTAQVQGGLVDVSKFLILLALSGIGLGVDFTKIRSIGIRPFILGFTVEAGLALASIVINLMIPVGL